MFDGSYEGKRVLVTGHTGFKGSWLCAWLSRLGAEITGYALDPPTEPNHFGLLELDIDAVTGDVRDAEKVKRVFKEQQPEVIFHLAAQPIVRLSYRDPAETFSTNVMGTISVFEAARECGTVRAIVNVTSDKCYENREWPWGYRETDAIGGYDPYSTSKACAELLTRCWRKSFFSQNSYSSAYHVLLASGRAGNVIGGGDWGLDRLVPDLMRAAGRNERVTIRNPLATRPWQHVLESLSGYLLLGQKLMGGHSEFAQAWNFGPAESGNATVADVAAQVRQLWSRADFEINTAPDQPYEAGMLKLDCSKARTQLRWTPVWDGKTAVEKTVLWYRAFYESDTVQSLDDLDAYIADAQSQNVSWAVE